MALRGMDMRDSFLHLARGHECLDTRIQSERPPGRAMGKRDRRADVLEDDPFRNQRSKPRIHRVHQRVDREGTVHIDASSQLGGALMQFLGRENWEHPKHHTGRIWHFSDV